MSTDATITFRHSAGGSLQMLTHYHGGYDAENPAHLAAAMLCQRMDDLAEPQGDPVELTQAQVEAMQAGADLPTHAMPELVIARG